ncbi:MAG: glycosyltransferase family 4 protein [Selenomonadaceae bacterium]|nr:glycosyltransferase family 4 protein [Selenomonadaceae bacterium]
MINKSRGIYCFNSEGIWSNQQLLKDCGIIPYLFYKNYGFHAVMVGAKSDNNYPYLNTYVKGLQMDFLPEDTLDARIHYVTSHINDIDILMLQGMYFQYTPLIDIYRQLRPDGKIYMATDANLIWIQNWSHHVKYLSQYLAKCDVVAASCRTTQQVMNIKFPITIELIRNGFYNFANADFSDVFDKKQDIILTVGRIGSAQKNNELLLEAFAAVADKIPEWKVRLVGSVEDSFERYIDEYFKKFPHLKDRVIFTGLIENKLDLMNEYKQAKIFAITSTYEGGTPNVIAEALYNGCYIVTSDIDGASDATNDGRCGKVFPIGDKNALIDILTDLCRDDVASVMHRGGGRSL